MPKRESSSSSKSREWERDRRERLNLCFKSLDCLLPSHDPSVTASKVDILQKAANYICDLQKENRDLVKSAGNKSCWKQVRQLKRRVEELLRRTQQLAVLLRNAGISIPPEPGTDAQMIDQRPLKWSNKIQQKDAHMFIEKAKTLPVEKKKVCKGELKKSQTKMVVVKKEGPLCPGGDCTPNGHKNNNVVMSTAQISISHIKKEKRRKSAKDRAKKVKTDKKASNEKLPTVAQLLGLSLNDSDPLPGTASLENTAPLCRNTANATTPLLNPTAQLPPGFIVIQRANPMSTSATQLPQQQSCFVMPPNTKTAKIVTSTFVPQTIPLVLSNTTNSSSVRVKQNGLVAVTNSHLLTAPIMATGIHTCAPPAVITNPGTGLAGLGPGTLILANGNIVPILPQSQTVLTTNPTTQFVINSGRLPTPQNQPVFVVQKNVVTTTSTSVPLVHSKHHPYPLCLPKPIRPIKPQGADTTRTTFANKVPIPALTSRNCHSTRPTLHSTASSLMLTKTPVNKNVNKTDSDTKTASTNDKINRLDSRKAPSHPKLNSSMKNIKSSIRKSSDENIENQQEKSDSIKISEPLKCGGDSMVVKTSNTEETISENGVDNSGLLNNTEVERETVEINGKDNLEGTHDEMEEECMTGNTPCDTVVKQDKNSIQVPETEKVSRGKRKQDDDSVDCDNKRLKLTNRDDLSSSEMNKVNDTAMPTEKHSEQTTSNDVQSSTSSSLITNILVSRVGNSGSYTIDALCQTKSSEINGFNKVDHTSKNVEVPEEFPREEQIIDTLNLKLDLREEAKMEELVSDKTTGQILEMPEISSVTTSTSATVSSSTLTTSATQENPQVVAVESKGELQPTCSANKSITQIQRLETEGTSSEGGYKESKQINESSESPEFVTSNSSITQQETVSELPDKQMDVCWPSEILSAPVTSMLNPKDVQSTHSLSPDSKQLVQTLGGTNSTLPDAQVTSESMPLTQTNTVQSTSKPIIVNIPPKSKETNVIYSKCYTLEEHHALSNMYIGNESSTVVNSNQKEDVAESLRSVSHLENKGCIFAPQTSSAVSLSSNNTFIPIPSSLEGNLNKTSENTEQITNATSSLSLSLHNNEFSSDLFASLQVPAGGQHSESISPTAAFLLAFPLVSTSKVTEMMVDSQEDVGSDSMQGTSTLLQIGNIDSDPTNVETITCITRSPPFHDIPPTEPVAAEKVSTTTATTGQDKNTNTVQSLDNNSFTSSEPLKQNKDSSLEMTNNNEKPTSNLSENGSKASNKKWMDIEIPGIPHSVENNSSMEKLKYASRSIGTQAYSSEVQALGVKPVTSNCVGNTLPPGMKTNGSDTHIFNRAVENKGIISCSSNYIENNTSGANNEPLSKISLSDHLASYKMNQYQTGPFDSFNSPTKHPTLSVKSVMKLPPNSTQKFHAQSRATAEASCSVAVGFSPHPVSNNEHKASVSSIEQHQLFPVKDLHPSMDNTLPHLHSVHTGVLQPNQIEGSTFPKHQQSTITEDIRCSNTNAVPFKDLKYSCSNNQCVVTSTEFNIVNSCKTSTYSQSPVTSSIPYSSNLFHSNDYPVMTSHAVYPPSYAQTSTVGEQSKPVGVSSFSVAHNSSNFSILSWTTLSPMAAMTNTNHYEVSQNNFVSAPSMPKGTGNQCSTTSMDSGMLMPPVPGINETCHQQDKNISHLMNNDNMHKMPGPFPNNMFVSGNEERHPSVANQGMTTTHLQFQHVGNRAQTTIAQGDTNAHFKFPPTVDAKTRQSARMNQSFSGGKPSHHQQQQTHRPPVNWMTAPDVRTSHNSTFPSTSSASQTPSVNPIMSTSIISVDSANTNKEYEFCNSGNNHNLFGSSTNTTLPPFDSRNFSNSSFYGSHTVSSHVNLYQGSNPSSRQIQLGPCQNEENIKHDPIPRISEASVSQNQPNDGYPLSWAQRKTTAMPSDLNNSVFVPSTLPTLVGDLALGTNYSLPMTDDSHINKTFLHPNFNDGDSERKGVMVGILDDQRRESSGKQIQARQSEKEVAVGTSKTRNNNNRHSAPDYRQSSGGSFLSVSQLVDQAKSGVGSSRVQPNLQRRSNHGNRQQMANNKPNNPLPQQPQSHHNNVSANTSDVNSKRNNATQNTSDKDTTRKSLPVSHSSSSNMAYPIGEGSNVMDISNPSDRENRKVNDISQTNRSNSHYAIENTSNLLPTLSQSAPSFSVTFGGHSNHLPASVSTTNVNWPSAGVMKHTNVRPPTSTYKAPVSSYSAEALIGLNTSQSDEGDSSLIQVPPTSNKVISLPPPMVSERFCHHQNYHHHSQVSRPLQIPPPFNADTIIPGNYFGSVELPTPHHQDGNTSALQPISSHHNNFSQHSHQNQQVCNNNSFNYPSTTPSMGSSAGQGNVSLYPASNFIPNVGSGHSNPPIPPPVSISSSFLPDLSGTNSYSGGVIPPDASNPFIFPPSTVTNAITRGSAANRIGNNGRHNLAYSHAPGNSVSSSHSGQQSSNRSDGSSSQSTSSTLNETRGGISSMACSAGNSNPRRVTGTGSNTATQQASNLSNNNCTLGKPRNRRRLPDPIISTSTSSGIGGLVDLGYLTMQPGIGSPLLTDDGMYHNHPGTFLTPGPQHGGPPLYPGGPTSSQGTLYPPPRPPVQTNNHHNPHQTNHLTTFPPCTTTHNPPSLPRTSQHHATASPNATNSSGTTLANFNLSTIFPEINDKQVPAASPATFPNTKNPLPPADSIHHGHHPPGVLEYTHRPPAPADSSTCLPPPPMPLHSNVNFGNILGSSAPQVCRMQWPQLH